MNKQQCHALITEEFSRFKDGESTQESRLSLAFKLTDEYYDQYGEYPHPSVLERLGTLLLVEELADKNPYKTQKAEYPFHNVGQVTRRHAQETSLVAAEEIAVDGVDYRVKTRCNNRRFRQHFGKEAE